MSDKIKEIAIRIGNSIFKRTYKKYKKAYEDQANTNPLHGGRVIYKRVNYGGGICICDDEIECGNNPDTCPIETRRIEMKSRENMLEISMRKV